MSGLRLCHVAVDDVGVLTVRHQRQVKLGALPEDVVKGMLVVHEHVACRRAHEELYARQAFGVQPVEAIGVAVCRAEEESVVDMAFLLASRHLVFPVVYGRRGRLGVWHVEERGDAAPCSRSRLAVNVGLVRESRLAEVDVLVDDAWHNETPRSIYMSVVDASGCLVFGNHAFNMVVVYYDGAFERVSLIDNRAILDDCPHIRDDMCLLCISYKITWPFRLAFGHIAELLAARFAARVAVFALAS